MEGTRKRKILLLIGIITMLTLVVGATYAYLTANIGAGAATDIIIQAKSIDSLQFTPGDPINLKITEDNFVSGGVNRPASTTATATLIAGTNRTPSYTYNVYLAINENTLKYTTEDRKPEIKLRIIDPSNNPVTGIEGLNEISTGVYDVTETSGLIQIAKDYPITTNTMLRQNWKVEVEAINLDTNQKANSGSVFSAKLMIQQENITLANYIKGLYVSQGENGLYYHDVNLPNSAADGSYRFSGANYVLTDRASAYSSVNDYDSRAKGVIKMNCIADARYSYVGNTSCTASDENYYYLAYDTSTHYASYEDAAKNALAEGYIKGNINNYVCFGSDAESCPSDNLYRIIGVFNGKVKLIKHDYANSDLLGTNGYYVTATISNSHYSYSAYKGIKPAINTYKNGNSNDWKTSLLNTTNLNVNYINNIGKKWSDMIDGTKWNIGGHNETSPTAKTYFDAEKVTQTTSSSKIGLMYVSDYGYAAISENWNNSLGGYNNETMKNYNWMYMGLQEWTIIPKLSLANDMMYVVGDSGSVGHGYTTGGRVVRPVFYLKSDTPYVGGAGTITNPYRISL